MEALGIACLCTAWTVLSIRICRLITQKYKIITLAIGILDISHIFDHDSRLAANIDIFEEIKDEYEELKKSEKLDIRLVMLTSMLMIVGFTLLLIS